MNRTLRTIEIPIDENRNSIEFRAKLSTLEFQFLSVTVCGAAASITFLEREGGGEANQSFFLYTGDQSVRCPERNSHLASFVRGDETYHLFGLKSLN